MTWLKLWQDKQKQVVLFSSTAIALYGYDQGMMSLINTNKDYLSTMGIAEEDPLVGVIVSVYYLGCAVGAVLASSFADRSGRKPSIAACLATTVLGNFIMFIAGLFTQKGALPIMFVGRVVMGLGVGGLDAVIPVYSSELSEDDARGKAMAQEFQANILGLNIAFAINLGVTIALGKENQWAWRIPIICMQVFPLALLALEGFLPESPRWFAFHERDDDAKKSIEQVYGEGSEESKKKLDELLESSKQEDDNVTYKDMFTPSHAQFHPTMLTVMGQVNQALTGYGAVSVYGPQIFELLGFNVRTSEYLTQANYISYLLTMTLAWLLIDALGRRSLMVSQSAGLTLCFLLLALFGGLAQNSSTLNIPNLAVAVPGTVALFIATANFGIGWLATVWLIPTEIFPTTARAQGTAVSVVVWGLANFAVTLLTPILFNNLDYWIFLVFAGTNLLAGASTYLYSPETGGRSFDENQEFFDEARKARTWRVAKVADGEYLGMPQGDGDGGDGEQQPLLSRVRDQL